jgi:nucleolar protein 56
MKPAIGDGAGDSLKPTSGVRWAVARPVWSDKAPDAGAVATHLAKLAETATQLRFVPVELPPGTDLGILHRAAIQRARDQLAASYAETDRILAQEVRAIDDLVRTANLLIERLREWYALHAPEATRLVGDAETLAKLVAEQGDRRQVLAAIDKVQLAESSLGSDLDPADMAVLRGFAAALAAVHESWHALERRVGELMETVAPNVAAVVGPVLGARMIAISGGLERLALWPAGTVQLLGAETALFRHIKEGTRPPKHGLLFQHPAVHQAPPWQRGALARALALAVSTASKADAFTKNDLRQHLAAQVKQDVERIGRERRAPPRPGRSRPTFRDLRFGERASRAPREGAFGRGPPREGGAAGAPPREGFQRGPPREGGYQRGPREGGYQRGPPREGGYQRGPPREGGYRGPPREGGYGRAPPREGFEEARGPPREGYDRGPPREGRGPPRSGGYGDGPAREGRGPPRDGYGRGPPRNGGYGGGAAREGRGPPRDGRGPPRDGAGGGKPFRRKPQGAFRKENKAARPPGRGDRGEE